jgi:hypothetical protein
MQDTVSYSLGERTVHSVPFSAEVKTSGAMPLLLLYAVLESTGIALRSYTTIIWVHAGEY